MMRLRFLARRWLRRVWAHVVEVLGWLLVLFGFGGFFASMWMPPLVGWAFLAMITGPMIAMFGMDMKGYVGPNKNMELIRVRVRAPAEEGYLSLPSPEASRGALTLGRSKSSDEAEVIWS